MKIYNWIRLAIKGRPPEVFGSIRTWGGLVISDDEWKTYFSYHPKASQKVRDLYMRKFLEKRENEADNACWLDDVIPPQRAGATWYEIKEMMKKGQLSPEGKKALDVYKSIYEDNLNEDNLKSSLKEKENGEVVDYKFGTDDYKKNFK